MSKSNKLKEGNNNKMSDISAIYILQYLDNFDNIVKKHQELYKYFKTQIIKMTIKLCPVVFVYYLINNMNLYHKNLYYPYSMIWR